MDIRGPEFSPVGEVVEFRCTYHESYDKVSFDVIDPSGNAFLPNLKKSNNDTIRAITFVTSAIGMYKINVFKNKPHLLLISSNCFAFNLEKEKLNMKFIHWNLETIDLFLEMRMHYPIIEYIVAQAHLLSTINNSIIPNVSIQCDLDILSDKSCKFYFTPPQFGSYEIRFYCNKLLTPGPRPHLHVINSTKWKLIHSFTTDKCLTSLKEKASFIFELNGAPSEFLKAWVICPNKSIVNMLLYGEEKNNKIGQLRCDFTPTAIGLHSLVACYQDVMFDKCPLEFHAYDATMVEIVNIDPDIDSGINPTVGQTLTITYNCFKSGSSRIDVTAFGSEDMGIYSPVPVEKLVKEKVGTVIFSIKLPFAGQYLIEGSYDKEKVNVFELEVSPVEIKKPIYIEPDFTSFLETNGIKRESQNSLGSISEPTKSIFGVILDSLEPLEEYSKSLILSINNESGCLDSNSFPILIGDGLIEAQVGESALFIVDPRREKGKLTVDVIGPKSLAKCLIKPESANGRYEVEYYPKEIGLYEITILWNEKLLPGSPFKVEATDPKSIQCTSHQEIFSTPLVLLAGRKTKIDFSYSLAGNGRLSACVKQDNHDIKHWTTVTKTIWTFLVESTKEGSFEIDVLWNNQILGTIKVQSIFKQDLSVETVDEPVSQILLKGRGLKGTWVGETAKFVIDTLNAEGDELLLNIQGNKSEMEDIPVKIVKLANSTYECSYQSYIPGQYLLHISFCKKIVKDSPFPINIWNKDPSREVKCYGDGLNHGLVEEINMIIIDLSGVFKDNSRESTEIANLLSVSSVGPDQKDVYCNLVKLNDNQYQVNLLPKVAGRHQLNIMYGDVHIPRSPFHPFYINKQSLEKLRVFGPGLRSSHLKGFESYFTVDTTQVGVGKLRVQVKGPKEAFRVEVQKNPTDSRLIKCSYNPTETGEYTISINWSGCPVKGSPFQILLD